MIVADTNVLSEALRRVPDSKVLAWLEAHDWQLAVTTVSIAELLFGAQRLPEGRRRAMLVESIDLLVRDVADRLWVFDEAAARSAAALRVARQAAGRPTSTADLMISAIAAAHGASVATRNVADFEGFGVPVVNPWSS